MSRKLPELLPHERGVLEDLDVSDIHWEAFFVSWWPLAAAGYTSSSGSLSPCHPAPVLLFMTNSLQQHQSLMTK